jgi:hypothetical protein
VAARATARSSQRQAFSPTVTGKDRGPVIQSSGTVKRVARFLRPERVIFALLLMAGSAAADPIPLHQWPQPVDGDPVYISYSYSNLLDGTFLLASPAELRSATEEALRLWARYAPLHFIEQPDSGPAVSDSEYAAAGYPQIRIGHHDIQDLAHAYFPGDDGLAGDVHVASGVPWSIGEGHWNFLETITHELGHSLGLIHENVEPAIMNPSYPSHRFHGLGTAYLYSSDIRQLQAIYGRGSGSVQPLAPAPEPATWILLSAGLAALARARRKTLSRSPQ